MRKHYDFSKGERETVIPPPDKTRITIMLDDDVIEFFHSTAEAKGTGYQVMVNAALREAASRVKERKAGDRPVTLSALRKALREELHVAQAS